MVQIITRSEAETKALARTFGAKLRGGEVLALSGNLGSGKTTFVKGLASGLALRKKIKSPTFVIMQAYQVPKKNLTFYHFDLYRLKQARDLTELGFREIVGNRRNIIVIEWPEKAKNILPPRTINIKFYHSKQANQRIIAINV